MNTFGATQRLYLLNLSLVEAIYCAVAIFEEIVVNTESLSRMNYTVTYNLGCIFVHVVYRHYDYVNNRSIFNRILKTTLHAYMEHQENKTGAINHFYCVAISNSDIMAESA